MLSERLSAEFELLETIFEADDYLLARVRSGEGTALAEVTPSPTVEAESSLKNPARRMSFPDGIEGVIYPLERRNLESGEMLLLFRDSSGFSQLYTEWSGKSSGGFGVDRALSMLEKLCLILRRLHDAGQVLGYLGPEMIMLDSSSRPHLRAGRRGVPDLPFSAPEAIGVVPRDPRSDCFALGTLLFRLVAGTDDRSRQIDAWNSLGSRVSRLIEKMVSDRPSDRFPNLLRLSREIGEVRAEIAGIGVTGSSSSPGEGRSWKRAILGSVATEKGDEEGFPGETGTAGRARTRTLRVVLPVVALAAVAALVVFQPWNCGSGSSSPQGTVSSPDTTSDARFVPPADTVSTAVEADTIETDSATDLLVPPDEVVIWVSNHSGVSGTATEFRNGPARGFSQVYPSTGQGVRAASAIMCRRADPLTPLSELPVAQYAESLAAADSIADLRPVDISVLLGRDLSHSGTNDGFLGETAAPGCTLFVEVVNYGLQYSLDGLGPATWVSSRIDGRSIEWNDTECVLLVTDTRDGDRYPNEELGLVSPLESTIFMYTNEFEAAEQAESILRQYFQALPDDVQGPLADLPVPDLWVLLGSD
jgi:hypothetical protein